MHHLCTVNPQQLKQFSNLIVLKSILHYAEACNEWRNPSPRLSAEQPSSAYIGAVASRWRPRVHIDPGNRTQDIPTTGWFIILCWYKWYRIVRFTNSQSG